MTELPLSTVPVPLPIRPQEGVNGYLGRVAAFNGFDKASWLTAAAGSAICESSGWDQRVLARIALLTGVPLDEFRCHTHCRDGAAYNFFGQTVPRSLIEKRNYKVCAACLREGGFLPGLFDLRVVEVCPRHSVRLVSTCPVCEAPLSLRAGSALSCTACCANLSRIVCEPVPEADLRGVRALAVRVGSPLCDGVVSSWPGLPELGHLTLGEIVELLIGLSNYKERKPTVGSFQAFHSREKGNVHGWLAEGYDLACEWPRNFHDLLDELVSRRRAAAGPGFGLKHDFGQLGVYLSLADSEPWLTVRQAFFDYLVERWDGVYVSRDDVFVPETVVGRLRYMTFAELRLATGVKYHKMRELLRAGLMPAEPVGSWKGAPLMIRRADVARVCPDGRLPIGIMEAGQILGVNFKKMPALVEGGALAALAGPSVDGSKTYVIRRLDVDAIVSDVRARLRTDLRRPGRLCTFSDLVRCAKERAVPMGPLLDAIRRGSIVPVAEGAGRGLARFSFDRDAARKVVDALDVEVNQETLGLRQVETVAVFGFWPETVTWLQDNGFLESTRGCAIGLRRTKLDEIGRFNGRWITMLEFADLHAFTYQLAREVLGEGGVRRLTSPVRRARCVDYYYERAEAMAIDVPSIVARITAGKEAKRAAADKVNQAAGIERRRVKNRLLKEARAGSGT